MASETFIASEHDRLLRPGPFTTTKLYYGEKMMVALNTLTRKVQKLEDLHCLRIDAELRNECLRSLAAERAKRELAAAVAIRSDDSDLIERLFRAGFTADNLPALILSPIALVAWGGGYVTDEERAVAMRVVYDSELSGNPAAIEKFQSWLDSRPDPELLLAWSDFTKTRIKNLRPAERDAYGDRLIRMAHEVAVASGGFLGLGAICKGEQDVIDCIRETR